MYPLRPFQQEALRALEKYQDVLCSAPTGAGKSRIFLEFLQRETTRKALLFSPLVALNRQHERNLLRAGVSASGPGSESRVWILSPESLQTPGGVARATRHAPDLIIVDEAHTVWEWGSGFRPAFHRIGDVLRATPKAQSLWLSATLSPEAKASVLALLPSERVKRAHQCGVTGIPVNLGITVENTPWRSRLERVLQFLRTRRRDPGVIFCPTRALTLQLAETLGRAQSDFRCGAYHAGLGREERQTLERQLREGALQLLCATSAFGMGVDLSLLRWCILWDPPPTLLALIQQMGRVTRSTEAAEALLFWSESDLVRLAARSDKDPESFRTLATFYQSPGCRRDVLLAGLQGRLSASAPLDPSRFCVPPSLCDRCRASERVLNPLKSRAIQ